MLRYASIVIALLITRLAFAQNMDAYDTKAMKGIKANTMYIVLTGDPKFDAEFQRSVADFWRQSPTKAISAADIENYLGNEKNYFMAPVAYDMVSADYDSHIRIACYEQDRSSKNIAIFTGKNKQVKQYFPSTGLMASCPYVFMTTTKDYVDAVGFAVRFLNDGVETTLSKKVGNNNTEGLLILLTKEKPPVELKNKTLLINKIYVGPYIKEEVMKAYKYKYKIATSDEIARILPTDNKEYCYLNCMSNFYSIYDIESKRLIYFYSASMMSVKLKEKNLEELNNCIEGKCSK